MTKISNLIPQSIKNIFHYIKALTAANYYGFPAKKLTVIGITGTDGKTTTSTILYYILKAGGLKVALISTVGAYIGDSSVDTGFHVTSPDPWSLQKLFSQISDQGYNYVVLEATSHGLDQHRLLGANVSIGVLTNITHEHLDYHKTYQRYLTAKAKLFKNVEVAVLNRLDMSYKHIKPKVSLGASIISYDHKSLSNQIRTAVYRVFTEKYNRLNATAAIQVAEYLGLSSQQIIKGLKSFPGIPGRMEKIKNKHKLTALVDFAHTPNGLTNALKAARTMTDGKLIAVYGSAGLRDVAKRPVMGRIGSELADEVVLTAEDPRTESVWAIYDQIMSGVQVNRGHVHFHPDRQQAINLAVSMARPGDTIIVLGKGHEKSMCFGKIEQPWSDQEALKKALAI